MDHFPASDRRMVDSQQHIGITIPTEYANKPTSRGDVAPSIKPVQSQACIERSRPTAASQTVT